MKEFMNHLLYGIHMWTQIIDPAPFYDVRKRASHIHLAYSVFYFFFMVFLLAFSVWLVRFVMGGHVATDYFKEYSMYHLYGVAAVNFVVTRICFKNNVDNYLIGYCSMPDSAHTFWKWLALVLIVLSVLFLVSSFDYVAR